MVRRSRTPYSNAATNGSDNDSASTEGTLENEPPIDLQSTQTPQAPPASQDYHGLPENQTQTEGPNYQLSPGSDRDFSNTLPQDIPRSMPSTYATTRFRETFDRRESFYLGTNEDLAAPVNPAAAVERHHNGEIEAESGKAKKKGSKTKHKHSSRCLDDKDSNGKKKRDGDGPGKEEERGKDAGRSSNYR